MNQTIMTGILVGAAASSAMAIDLRLDDQQGTAWRPLAPEPHPYTTEKGRFMLELTPMSYAIDRRNPDRADRRVRTFDINAFIKYGVTDDLDIQIGADLYTRERVSDRDEGFTETASGIGDLTIRLKRNLWGNDGGDSAGAIMPFITLPTGSRDVRETGVRGGVMVPLLWDFADGWTIEGTPTIAAVRDSEDDGYEAEFAGLVVLTREIVEGIDIFTEFEASVTTESGEPWVGAFGVGLTFELGDHTVIEPVFQVGVTRSAPDYAFAVALVRRF
ncbi:MAG: transporter [Phycisphaerales bacterium]|nr:transporter [Planctomycetota bacterium]MCH8508944.1 transporter [Phycisphaerales bacterium]